MIAIVPDCNMSNKSQDNKGSPSGQQLPAAPTEPDMESKPDDEYLDLHGPVPGTEVNLKAQFVALPPFLDITARVQT